MKCLIPMAGEGLRFKNQGYRRPKPLLPVRGVPMVVQAIQHLPLAREYVLICRYSHLTDYNLDKELKPYVPEALILTLGRITDSQLDTILEAKHHLETDESILVAPSDGAVIMDYGAFDKLIADESVDMVVIGFKGNPVAIMDSLRYSWLRVTPNSYDLTGITNREPISQQVADDYACSGVFWFRSGQLLLDILASLPDRPPLDFGLEECVNQGIALGKKAVLFPADYFVSWGTPADMIRFEYWEQFFKHQRDE